MNTDLVPFVVLCSAVVAVLSLIAGGMAVTASVLYRSTVLSKELATRRVIGARRSHIVRMFLAENVLGIAAGLGVGTLALLAAGELRYPWFLTVLLTSAALLAVAAFAGGWIAARHASKVPFSKSGLFRTSSDVRGQR